MSLFPRIAPSTKDIQKQYVEKRQRQLYANDDAKTEAVKKKIAVLQAKNKATGDWHDIYLKIHRALQGSSLTINLEAGSWFLTENTYATYSQMYQRSVGSDGKMVLTDKDPKNPAILRAVADDLVTIPDEWGQAQPWTQRKRLYKALHVTGATNPSLKNPSNPDSVPRIKGDKDAGYTTTNKHFKPKAKQIFAALNYAQRPHGSSTYYGYSYMILQPALKANAIYFPGDTFYLSNQGTRTQATFNTIGALLERASPKLMDAMWSSCHDGHRLPDTSDGDVLIEAHLFKELKIAEDVQDLVLSRMRKDGVAPWTDEQWRTIIENATKWCRRNHVRLIFASP